ncbi:MAG: MBL fold metallo-hydrolase [Candidatus Parcubacteria bacterium]|nr:MBL fold metallo-hydrolase [Candidatus Parcubacteria bacterium]
MKDKIQKFGKVKVLVTGYFKWLGLGRDKFKASSTATLIQDNGKNMLVDTGNQEVEKKLISALKKQGLEPKDIDYVILTHHHPDHTANKHLFKQAIITDWLTSYKKDKFIVDFDIINKGKNIITPNVCIKSTPGHALDEGSVIVKTADGSVAIAGDLFFNDQSERNIFVHDVKDFKRSRKEILALADFIVPGHGGMFKVKK